MAATIQIESVLSRYSAQCRPVRMESLGSAGGFSGATFWRLSTPLGTLCLRRWPAEHPSPERLSFIHAVLWHVEQSGFRQLPVPLCTRDGRSLVAQDGSLWELTPWLAGTADYRQNPSRARLEAALHALAQFHRAASTFPRVESPIAASPAVSQRARQVRELLSGGWKHVSDCVRPGDWPELEPRAVRLLALFAHRAPRVLKELTGATDLHVPMQPCIRDIWHDHVLFRGDDVSGLIDFGALRIETVAADVSRLLGSLVGDDLDAWQVGLAAYQAVRPLSSDELRLVTVLDRSSVLLSGMNWLSWIYVEKRSFENRPQILARLDESLTRVGHLR